MNNFTAPNALLLGVLLLLLAGCDEAPFGPCPTMNNTEISLLIDISDEVLYQEVRQDLEENFSNYISKTPISNLPECESATVLLAPLSAKQEYSVKRASINIDRKGLSRITQRELKNPEGIITMLRSGLQEFDQLSKNDAFNQSSTLMSTIVKSINEFSNDADATLLIFSDMVVNNKDGKVSFYQNIPDTPKGTIPSLVDDHNLQELEEKLDQGFNPKIVVIQKQAKNKELSKDAVRQFWTEAFEALGLDRQLVFIDNLSNTIK